MKKQKNIGTRRLAKEVIKESGCIGNQMDFPIYMVVLSRDKNDEIMIIPQLYSGNLGSTSTRIDTELLENEKRLPSEKPIPNKGELVKK
jgi:hypothetical protein